MCGENYSTKYSLKKHISAIHTHSDSEIQCEMCAKRFKSANALGNHTTIIHDNIKQHKCDIQSLSMIVLQVH